MKFFSNDAKENSDEPHGHDHGDVVTSDPVTVPQQRAGSPWSDAPATTEAETSGTTEAETSDTTETDTEVGSPDDELAEQERRDGTEEEPASRRDETDTLTTYHPDGTVETEDQSDAEDRADKPAEEAAVVEPATGEPLSAESDEPESESDEPESDPALRREVEDEPAAVAEETETETAKDRAEAQAEADDTVAKARADEAVAEQEEEPAVVDAEPVPAAAEAAPATPGSVPAPALDRLFSDGDSFAERFREIQMRFVDSPKEATADAAALVGEAVDKLTSALQAQKDALGGDSDDTEQLRVQLRSYRDLLNRLSAL
jgi:hypothetical protein